MMRDVVAIAGITPAQFRDDILPAARPVVLRGLAAAWPAIGAADTIAYLKTLANDHPCELLVGPPAIALQSVSAAEALPGFAEANRIDLLATPPGPRLWIGNRTVTALHHDVMSNIAVAVAGRRRFVLIPPEEVANLYMGPFEFTPAGTPVSLVDPEAPDLERFPRAASALQHAQVAELEPGDALYIPYMWWHQVRSRGAVSVLANYWWNEAPASLPGLAPIDALVHALLALGPLPPAQRAAWRAMLDAVLSDTEMAHIPPHRRGIRGELPSAARERLRRQLGTIMAKPL